MTKNILIYGFGGFGREIASIILSINNNKLVWNIAGFIDDGIPVGTENRYGKVLGNLDFLNAYNEPVSVVMAIATPKTLEKIVSKITNPNITFPNIIAPGILYFDEGTFKIGQGNLIGHGCRFSTDVEIGNFNLINGMVSFGHDVKAGNYNIFQPETRISGETTIGNTNFFGVRSLVLQGLKIGNYTRIGTGSVIMRKTKDGMTYFGNPAKILKIQ